MRTSLLRCHSIVQSSTVRRHLTRILPSTRLFHRSAIMSSTVPASAAPSAAAPAGRPLLMIPGPIEFHPDVIAKIGEPTPGHVAAGFIEEYGRSLGLLRVVLRGDGSSQPFILAGSGTLGWEIVASNLLEAPARPAPGEKVDAAAAADAPATVLVVNTGYFSDSWSDCFRAFGHRVTSIAAPAIGDTVQADQLLVALKANPHVKLVALTHVDTSTGVRNDIQTLAKTVKEFNKDIFVAVDGVCSFGGEVYEHSAWGIDASLTCSQKAIGVPPGLCLALFSKTAMEFIAKRSTPVPSYYANLQRWLPIMNAYEKRTPSYFATPAVNLIRGLRVALGHLEAKGMEQVWNEHKKTAQAFKKAAAALGLKEVPTAASHSAFTLSCLYYPAVSSFDVSKFLPGLVSNGVVCAGGLHKDIKARYFRVGHMGYSVLNELAHTPQAHVRQVVSALEKALNGAGAGVQEGAGLQAFDDAIKA